MDEGDAHLISAILRYLVDEKKLLTQDDVDAILDKAEEYRQQSEQGFAQYQSSTPAERKRMYRHLNPVEELDSQE